VRRARLRGVPGGGRPARVRQTTWPSDLSAGGGYTPRMPARLGIDQGGFNLNCRLPYELRVSDFESAMRDLYDLLRDINTTLEERHLRRIEESVRPAIFTGMISDLMAAGLAQHSRVLVTNSYHNGHPDLLPRGEYPNDAVKSGDSGVEVKTTRGRGSVDAHGARPGWMCLFRYEVDAITQPARSRRPTEITEILIAELTVEDFRRNERSELGTRTASPNREGLAKLRTNWVFRKATPPA